ncbi:alpha/beta fold hydrolase [Planotetraspora sp. A-T 1434]|uniref:alpha/beta fold hydrolase n=1 Tax=Planotetraspora sp. A-T 1434 TaxID=2979219 RepID=UPI0021BDFBC6|nr:alpha/beta hydrolase [Planotetraspora sp. A-T 1434]MCT9929867.1 alpha/beta fold hydrolase [Planotetraspora sp. A-T 1434]
MTEQLVRANGVNLCVETFGSPRAPAILLISGAAASMDWWDAEFCRRLAAGGRFVIRYDHRDTGRSVGCPPGAPGYSGLDLAGDAVALIDLLAAGRAHVVGLSMGGGIGQYVAINHPGRVATLTLMSTSSGPADDLPAMADRLKAAFADPVPDPDWADPDAVVDYLVESQRPFAGPDSFDEADVRATARRVVERTVSLESSQKNHWLIDGGADIRPRLGEIAAPTLVIHGTEDPFFPPGHAHALKREIPGAELLLLDGIGHQPPPRPTWNHVVPAVLRHTLPDR